jgi:isoleucyl-tRNA synthetase
VHLSAWPAPPACGADDLGPEQWAAFLAIRDAVMKALETRRSEGAIGSPLESQVTLLVSDASLRALCDRHRDTLAEAFVVSQVEVQASGPAAATGVPGLSGVQGERAQGTKCARCWKYLKTVGQDPAHPALCDRCARVVGGQHRY